MKTDSAAVPAEGYGALERCLVSTAVNFFEDERKAYEESFEKERGLSDEINMTFDGYLGTPQRHETTPNALQKKNTAVSGIVVTTNASWTNHLLLTGRCLAVVLDRPPTTSSNFFSYSSTLRGCPTKFYLVNSGSLFSSTAHLLVLIAALMSRFTNSIRFLPSLDVLNNASSPRTFALLSICSSVNGPCFAISSGLR
jgi:hypothetical protein